jgi:hypothetical protein
MKKIVLFLTFCAFNVSISFAQDANVSLSNISNNNGYTGYSGTTVSGIYFEVLSDGTNSNNVISDFEVSLYLLPCNSSGTATSSTPVIIKVYSITGMQQLHSIDYTSQSVDLNQVSGLTNGNYRLGVWVNSNTGVPQPPDNGSDNASLITLNSNGNASQSVINFTATTTTTGVMSLQDLGIVIPSPLSQDQLSTIVLENNFDSVKLIDLVGQEQNIASLNKGIYIARISKNNLVYTGKIIVQ